jgi:hypothetical protein
MLYDLPIPFLPNQEQRWNQHSFLKRIPSDSLFEECALDFGLSRFLNANRSPLRSKTL